MIRRASVEDAEQLSEWTERDFDAETDFTVFFANPLNVCLIYGQGCACFVWHGPGVFEVHVALEQRGKSAMRACHAVFDVMRREHRATLFWAAIPYDETKKSRKVRMFTRLMGWRSQGLAALPHGLCELFTGE